MKKSEGKEEAEKKCASEKESACEGKRAYEHERENARERKETASNIGRERSWQRMVQARKEKETTKSFNDDFTRGETARATMAKSKFTASRAAS